MRKLSRRCTRAAVLVCDERLDENIKCEECSAKAGGLQQEPMSLVKLGRVSCFQMGGESVCVASFDKEYGYSDIMWRDKIKQKEGTKYGKRLDLL